MKNIVLSIVIPVYNLEKYIERCLDSCLDQNLDKDLYEIICVDDGSSDGTYDILENYSAKYTNVKVVHTKNQGVVKARNHGLTLVQGEYIWFVDGDDWIQKIA